MQPAFSAGDIIVIKNNSVPKVNDIVTYKHPDGIFVSHRIIQVIKKDGQSLFKTKGDNNNIDDHILVPRKDILGIEKLIVPKAGYVAKFVSGPVGLVIFILIPLLTLIIIEIFERLGLINKKKQKRTQTY